MTRLTLNQAQTIIDVALKHGTERKMHPLAVVVLDDRGVPKAVAAQDGTSLRRFEIARGKAHGALSFGLGSRTLAIHAAHLTRGPAGDSGDGTGTLLEVHGRQGGIVVDEVLYSQYLPVRPAPSYLRRSCGLIGYGLGAGGVILPILDLAALIDRAAPAQAVVASSGTRAKAATARGSDHHTVLIVDDSQTMRRALSRTFERAGFAVREAANGREALTAFGQAVPDLITLDMEMPGMDGLETLSALRLLPGGSTIPIFMITSRQQSRHRAAAISAGVTRYVTKPYNDDEVIGAARLAIAESPLMAEAAS